MDVFDHQIWEQLRSLPLLLSKTKEMKSNPKSKATINLGDVQNIVNDIGSYLRDMEIKNNELSQQLQEEQMTLDRIFGDDDENEDGEN